MSGHPKSREYHMKQANADAPHGGKDHHSGVVKGRSKKGGAGKGAWGKPGVDDLAFDVSDMIDPEMPEDLVDYSDADFIIEVTEHADSAVTIVHDFFHGADFEDCNETVKEAIEPAMRPRFVKKAMHISMDLRAYERELCSRLFCNLTGDAISRQQLEDGFQLTLSELPDTVLDVPEAVDMVGKFMARAVLDEILAPAFLDTIETDNPRAAESVKLAKGHVKAPHFGPRLAHVWGPGDLCSVKRMIQECRYLLEEYLNTKDENEAIACLQRLNAPSFHPRFVRELIRIGLERGEDDYRQMIDLLKRFMEINIVSQNSIGRGFKIVTARKNDFKLDFPMIDDLLPLYTSIAREKGLLPADKAEEEPAASS